MVSPHPCFSIDPKLRRQILRSFRRHSEGVAVMSEEKKKLVSMKCLPRSNVFPYLFLQLKELQGQYIASDIVQHPPSVYLSSFLHSFLSLFSFFLFPSFILFPFSSSLSFFLSSFLPSYLTDCSGLTT